MPTDGLTTVLEPRPLPNFVQSPFLQAIADRALTFTSAGFPIHFRGPSGSGKTTLAMHVASQLGRPVVMIHGDEEVSTADLVGGERGYRMTRVIDNFIHSVLKTEEDVSRRWIDNRLTTACRHGFTLIYDEFTRSRPEANNVLLAVLQEKMLDVPMASDGEEYLRVHPHFTAIFTSNPEEYVGVYRTQDALQDRMVTLDLDYFDEETEVEITVARSGIERIDAEAIVRLVRGLRESGACPFPPTVRSAIKLARAMKVCDSSVTTGYGLFHQLCIDVLVSGCSRGGNEKETAPVKEALFGLMDPVLRQAAVGGPDRDPGRRFGDESIQPRGRE